MLADGGGVARPRSKRQRSDATAAAKGPEKEQVDKEDNDEEEAEAEEEADNYPLAPTTSTRTPVAISTAYIHRLTQIINGSNFP